MTMKHIPLFTAAALLASAGSASAATIVYDFESAPTAFEQNSGGTDYTNWTATGSILSSVGSNDFGLGVTASNWSFTAGSSPNRYIGFVTEAGQAASDGVEARAMLGDSGESHSFTITIPIGVTVDLTNLAWESGTVFAEHAWELDIVAGSGETFSTTGNPITTTLGGTRREVNNSESLSGLTGLTNTTVTVTIADTTPRNNTSTTFYSFVDNVVLTGSAVPEPGSLALMGLGGLLIASRRRRM